MRAVAYGPYDGRRALLTLKALWLRVKNGPSYIPFLTCFLYQGQMLLSCQVRPLGLALLPSHKRLTEDLRLEIPAAVSSAGAGLCPGWSHLKRLAL